MDRASRAGDSAFLDVGQGDCAHLRDGGTNIIFDSGGSDTYDVGENILIPYFLANGVSELDLAVISHLRYGSLRRAYISDEGSQNAKK